MFPVHENESGSFQELAHKSDVNFGQLSILTVKPGFTRGGHYHTIKEEWFCCSQGTCTMRMVDINTGAEREIKLSGEKREFIRVAPYENHYVTNNGMEDCELLIIISEEYDPEDEDTFKHEG